MRDTKVKFNIFRIQRQLRKLKDSSTTISNSSNDRAKSNTTKS